MNLEKYINKDLCIESTNFEFGQNSKIVGKIRDNYFVDDYMISVVTDRVSVFDIVIGVIPFKGQMLNRINNFWFKEVSEVVPTHFVEEIDPSVTVFKAVNVIPIEVVVRKYLTGDSSTSIWTHYKNGCRDYCGIKLPDNMRKNEPFDNPIITPTTKAPHGEHDELISESQIVDGKIISSVAHSYTDEYAWELIKDMALKLFKFGEKLADKCGLILVDTKYEFGIDSNRQIIVIDEINTQDSSRYWIKDDYDSMAIWNKEPVAFSKDYIRQWCKSVGFNGSGSIPTIPSDIMHHTVLRYATIYKVLTGTEFIPSLSTYDKRKMEMISSISDFLAT
jgi:phosphoribosylaminoimidazole-succinocarboxamide synthase